MTNHTTDSIISFEELYDKLSEYDTFLKREESHSDKSSFIIKKNTCFNMNKDLQQ